MDSYALSKSQAFQNYPNPQALPTLKIDNTTLKMTPQEQQEIRELQNKISEYNKRINFLKNRDKPISLFQELPSFQTDKNIKEVKIEFDGGTSCNIPIQGFGHGYGSYQIEGQEIIRVKFGLGHSCNSAEIRTATAALLDLASQYDDPSIICVLLRGDSKIALKWANPNYTSQPKQESTNNFIIAIKDIRIIASKFKSIRTQWRGRQESVRIFGH